MISHACSENITGTDKKFKLYQKNLKCLKCSPIYLFILISTIQGRNLKLSQLSFFEFSTLSQVVKQLCFHILFYKFTVVITTFQSGGGPVGKTACNKKFIKQDKLDSAQVMEHLAKYVRPENQSDRRDSGPYGIVASELGRKNTAKLRLRLRTIWYRTNSRIANDDENQLTNDDENQLTNDDENQQTNDDENQQTNDDENQQTNDDENQQRTTTRISNERR